MKYFLFFVISVSMFAQSGFDSEIDSAYSYAKKGVYWAFANIPETKKSATQDIIRDDQLIAEVKLYKEFEGVKVDVTGYFKTYKVNITAYKSYATLKAEGYIKENQKSFFD